ncbi:MAG: hypothetical protein K0R38_1045 [Polyangiaceae bacterium]|jgi:hypothetical protein|nr:hypothetical protein [Polyangiaceae bacterium]
MTRVDALLVTSDSDCPTPASIQAEVRELTTPEQRAGVPADAKVMVSDHGATIAVAITRDGKTTVRVYRDAARDCARRAHFVSVLAVVALMPPDLGSDAATPEEAPPPTEPEPPPVPEAVARPPAPAQQPSKLPRVRIELGARGDVSAPLSDTVRVALPSAALGVALGAGDARFTLGTSYAPQSEVRYTGASAGSAELSRFDVALGVRYVFAHAPLDASIDASMLLTRQELTGRSSERPMRDTAFSAGGRVGIHVCWSERSVVSPFLGAYATVFPFAPALSQLPQGTVGHLPYLWLGLSGGLALAL